MLISSFHLGLIIYQTQASLFYHFHFNCAYLLFAFLFSCCLFPISSTQISSEQSFLTDAFNHYQTDHRSCQLSLLVFSNPNYENYLLQLYHFYLVSFVEKQAPILLNLPFSFWPIKLSFCLIIGLLEGIPHSQYCSIVNVDLNSI